MKNKIFGLIRKWLLEGFFVLLPLGITLLILKKLFRVLIEIFEKPFFFGSQLLGYSMSMYWLRVMFSGVILLCILFAAGVFIQNYVGHKFLKWLNFLIMKVPGVSTIYGVAKQVGDTIQDKDNKSFKEVVIVQWPTPESRMLGFLTCAKCDWATDDGVYVTVIIPVSPLPTANLVLTLHHSLVKPANITAKEAIVWIVSYGSITPSHN